MENLPGRDDAGSLLAAVRASRAAEESAARNSLILAARYAAASTVHTVGEAALIDEAPGGGEYVERLTGEGAPLIAEGAVVEFAAVLGYTTVTGRKYLADAVELSWRLPRCWARVLDGTLAVYRARRVAEVTRSLGPDAADWVDRQVVGIAHRTGLRQLERVAVEAAALFEPDTTAAQADQAQAERRCAITTDPALLFYPAGQVEGRAALALAEVSAVLDAADAVELEAAVSQIAHDLLGHEATADWSLDARRSAALGVMARAYNSGHMPQAPGTGRVVELVVHTDTRDLAGTGIGRCVNTRGLVTLEHLQRWATLPGVVIKPTIVIDLAEEITTTSYVTTTAQRRQAFLAHEKCSFPYCQHRAESCDIDHRIPYDKNNKNHKNSPGGGATTTSNLTPLCRRHHRAKTHMGWSYDRIGPVAYRWRSPRGYLFVVTPQGTIDTIPDIDTADAHVA